MSESRVRLFAAATALGVIGAFTAVSVPAAAASQPPPGSEGPAGPPALMPNGQVASPPQVTAPQVSAGCPAASYGAKNSAPGSGKTVALTFDDGPGASTAGILSILGAYGIPATFFNIGQNMAARPSLVRQEASTGYQVGNHTWDHPNMATLPASAQGTEMDRATAEQVSLTGPAPCAFRPPGGNYNATTLTLAQQRRMTFWTWSVDTEDWKAKGSSSSYWVNRIISLAEKGGSLQHPVVLMHNQPAGNPATILALPTIIKYFRSHGYTFVDLLGRTQRLGYNVLTSDGGVHSYGTPSYGSDAGKLTAGVTAAGLAADTDTGGYWILKSDGGVDAFHAPWHGSLRTQVPAGQTVTGIAGTPGGGYLVLTSDGGVHGYGTPWYGSDAGKLTAGVTAAGLAADTDTGGYWILKSDGGVDAFHAPWHGSLRTQVPAGQTVSGIAAE